MYHSLTCADSKTATLMGVSSDTAAGLLRLFLRSLPDCLFTSAQGPAFVEVAKGVVVEVEAWIDFC